MIETTNDYVCYVHTDSNYISIEKFLIDQGIDKVKWDKLDIKVKVKFIEKIAQEIETYVNDLSLEETQKLHYNSQEKDFAIIFETEKISLSAIFAAKARYATWDILKDGKWKDAMSITGLEIIRSDSPEIVKPMIKNILEMMLKDFPDEEIRNNIEDCKVKLKNCNPLEIAENKGINKIDKYSVDVDENKMEDSLNEDYQFKSGTPHQVKGTLNFNFLVDKFNLGNRYEIPTNGNKAKVVYLQKNPYKLASLSFIEWPKEFDDNGIKIDYNKMIENNFTKKVKNLLALLNKEHLLDGKENIKSLFF